MVSLANCNQKISELMTLLKNEIKMLRAGHYKDIKKMSAEKAQKTKTLTNLLSQLHAHGDDDRQAIRKNLAPRLVQLKQLSQENGQLLQAVKSGLKFAQDRIYALENQNAQVGVYGRQGRTLSFEEQPCRNEKTF